MRASLLRLVYRYPSTDHTLGTATINLATHMPSLCCFRVLPVPARLPSAPTCITTHSGRRPPADPSWPSVTGLGPYQRPAPLTAPVM
jgi:hypothetical protein